MAGKNYASYCIIFQINGSNFLTWFGVEMSTVDFRQTFHLL